ncbi:MAG TPA: ABC transporter ATP-binding protein [Clostridiales bacterium]|nr:ABC transporter ATP-binding protein [Clostridiales bacterium]
MDIKLTNVSKSFDKKTVISDMSFSISSGDIVCLLGPSGSGKTTIIRLLIGAIASDRGTIHFGETKVPDLKLLKQIGFMPQNDALYDDLSGEDNLRFFGGFFKMGKSHLEKRITEVLELVDLSDHRKKYIRNYSGGMKKRLSLAATLLHEPDVLLLDEPTVGIDPVLRHNIWNQFKAIKATGKTIIVSTHVMDEVTECDKAALIYNGRLINYDSVENLLSKTKSGKVEELFIEADKRQKGGEAL